MDYNYSKRGYLLPIGCKDLIDTIDINPSDIIKQDNGLMLIFKMPGLRSENIEIVVERSHLRIIRKFSGSQASPESTLEVPIGYDITRAHATYIKDTLRIFIPKC